MTSISVRVRLAALTTTAVALIAGACAPPPTLTPQQQVDQIIAFVEQARGHQFVVEPMVEFLDPATFEAEVLANLNASEADVDAEDATFTALGWITPAQDLFTEYRKAFGGGVVGFYDPVSKALKVRGTTLTPYRREVIAHELTHALDDQIHDLGDLSTEGLLDEEYNAALVAVEGSAERVRSLYSASMTPLEQFESISEQLASGGDPELLTIPITLLTLTSVPYLRGLAFQQELAAALGHPAGNDLSLDRYPASTEQAFDTAKYIADEAPLDVPVPPTDGGAPALRSGEFGALMLSLVLREGLVLDELDPLADAWTGGSYVTWLDGPLSCTRAQVELDSPADAGELETALLDWGDRHPGAAITSPAPTTVQLTRCA